MYIYISSPSLISFENEEQDLYKTVVPENATYKPHISRQGELQKGKLGIVGAEELFGLPFRAPRSGSIPLQNAAAVHT